jgi:hypothetical protein
MSNVQRRPNMDYWRAQPTNQQRLPVIAPREEQSLHTPKFSTTDLPRTRLPPRSRSGCW